MIETEIVVIGSGLTGLTLAHYLGKNRKDFLVLERSLQPGGAIQTVEQNGFLFEKGPNTGVLGNEIVPSLFDDLQSHCTLQLAGNSVKKRYILKNDRWEPLPSGLIQGISTPLFSFADKIRLLGEPFRKPGTNPYETLDQLVIRRMGKTFLDYAVDPFILGVYAGDPSYLVPRFALPKLYNLEQKYGSFIGGSVKLAREKKKSGIKSRATREIFSVQGGLKYLIRALQNSAGRDHFMYGIHSIRVQPKDGGFLVSGIDSNGEEILISARKVVTTTGAHELPYVLPFLDKDVIGSVSNLRYAKVVQVSLGFKKWDGMPLDGFGGLIPFKEKKDVLGVLFPSAFYPERAPHGGALLSVFLGGVRNPDIFELSESSLEQLVTSEITRLMGLKKFDPDVYHVSRYTHAIPQYGKDSEARFATVENIQKKYKGLWLAGNLRDGIGMADRIRQGYELSEEVK